LQIQPEGFETVLRSIGFKPAQRLGERGEGREYLDLRLVSGTLIDESFRFPSPSRPVCQAELMIDA